MRIIEHDHSLSLYLFPSDQDAWSDATQGTELESIDYAHYIHVQMSYTGWLVHFSVDGDSTDTPQDHWPLCSAVADLLRYRLPDFNPYYKNLVSAVDRSNSASLEL